MQTLTTSSLTHAISRTHHEYSWYQNTSSKPSAMLISTPPLIGTLHHATSMPQSTVCCYSRISEDDRHTIVARAGTRTASNISKRDCTREGMLTAMTAWIIFSHPSIWLLKSEEESREKNMIKIKKAKNNTWFQMIIMPRFPGTSSKYSSDQGYSQLKYCHPVHQLSSSLIRKP